MKLPKISIVVPIYNVERFLPFCLDSILKQTYTNLEIILVNDGSTDSSLTICNKYASRDKRIQVIHQENHGLSYSRNKGIEVASSKYISFIDADDIIAPDFCEHLLHLLTSNNADIAECKFIKISETDLLSYTFPASSDSTFLVLNSIEALNRIHNDNLDICVNSVIACNKLYKTKLFKEIQYPVGKIYEDEHTTYKLFYKAKKIVFSNIPLYGYIQRQSSIMNKPFSLSRLGALEPYDNYMSFFKNLGDTYLIQKCERRYLRLLVLILTELENSDFENKPYVRNILKEKFDEIYVPDETEDFTVKPDNMLQSKTYYYNKFQELMKGSY